VSVYKEKRNLARRERAKVPPFQSWGKNLYRMIGVRIIIKKYINLLGQKRQIESTLEKIITINWLKNMTNDRITIAPK
jgi:hypothetical protein